MDWFTADLHFDDARLLERKSRDFPSVTAMNDFLLNHINVLVKKNDRLYINGDFAARTTVERAIDFRRQIHCRNIYLVRGNHDRRPCRFQEFERQFVKVKSILELHLEGRLFVLCHYPMRYWHNWDEGSVMLHGHMHGMAEPLGDLPTFDIGIDVWGQILKYSQVLEVIQQGLYKLPSEQRKKHFQ